MCLHIKLIMLPLPLLGHLVNEKYLELLQVTFLQLFELAPHK
jgi:hypothetical protein